MASSTVKVCDWCGNTDPNRLKHCSRCRLVHYCSKDCQRDGWKAHKPACIPTKNTSKPPTFKQLPDPPYRYESPIAWTDPVFDKKVSSLLPTDVVREAIFKKLGFWPTIPTAPDWMGQEQYNKFCHGFQTYECFRKPEQPPGFIPTPPLNFKAPIMCVYRSSNPETKDERAPSKTIKLESTFDDNVLNVIADFLDPIEWCQLRFTCNKLLNCPKPPPRFSYECVYFYLSDNYAVGMHGMGRTL
jgi:hypothetical protein